MYLRSFEYFRAVTIVLIVVGHCYGVAGWVIDTFPDRVLANVVSGGTSLFVFISGFLFHHVFYPKFEYKSFMKKKVNNVYIPYLILSFIPVCVSLSMKMPYKSFYFGPTESIYDQIIRPFFLYYWYGGVLAYWYIPFIMSMFIVSPLFIWFIKIKKDIKIILIVLFSLISIFMHRPSLNLSIPQSLLYFISVYMIGIFCSMEKETIYKKFQGKDGYLFLGVILLATLQAWVTDVCGNLQKSPFEYGGVDISFLQKIGLSLFLMVFLHRFEDKEVRVLKQLAASSFSIYFLHGWVIFFIWLAQERRLYTAYSGLQLLPIVSVLVIWASYFTALHVRRIFPGKSRMIIGW